MPAVIFDLDDTLYPHVQHVHSGFAAVATHVARHSAVTAKDAYATLRSARESDKRGNEFQWLCQVYRLDPALVPALVREYREHRPQLWLTHGAAEALGALRTAGWRTAILTNGDPGVQAGKVQALGLEAMVDHVVYASEHAPGGKPAREPFLEVLRRLQSAPDDTVMVGDDPVNDVDGARAVGIRTIFLVRAGRPHHEGANAVVHLLSDVPRAAAALVARGMAHAA
jgi:putative hydrolase of the HAD superfamily